jgi:hypothetical protein
MPITPKSILPTRRDPEQTIGEVVSVGTGVAGVRIRPDLTIACSVPAGAAYVVGQIVIVSMPGTGKAGAQIIGPAAGTAGSVRHVHVPFKS